MIRSKYFINKLESLNYEIIEHDTYLNIYKNYVAVCSVSKTEQGVYDTNYPEFINLPILERLELLNLVHKYSKTPIPARDNNNEK